jgi:hypothetical protein
MSFSRWMRSAAQGALGDCYFLAALANVAEHDELVQDLIVEDYAHLGL